MLAFLGQDLLKKDIIVPKDIDKEEYEYIVNWLIEELRKEKTTVFLPVDSDLVFYQKIGFYLLGFLGAGYTVYTSQCENPEARFIYKKDSSLCVGVYVEELHCTFYFMKPKVPYESARNLYLDLIKKHIYSPFRMVPIYENEVLGQRDCSNYNSSDFYQNANLFCGSKYFLGTFELDFYVLSILYNLMKIPSDLPLHNVLQTEQQWLCYYNPPNPYYLRPQ